MQQSLTQVKGRAQIPTSSLYGLSSILLVKALINPLLHDLRHRSQHGDVVDNLKRQLSRRSYASASSESPTWFNDHPTKARQRVNMTYLNLDTCEHDIAYKKTILIGW